MQKEKLTEKKKNRKIEIIVNDALHYFEKNGYDNTTIDQLCEAAMISQSTFFNYFGTKEKIVELIMEDGLKEYREYAEKAMESMEDPFEAAKSGLLFLCDATEKYCHIMSDSYRMALHNEELRRIQKEHEEIGASMVEKAFERTGRTCPMERDVLMTLLGGCFTNPFLVLPPEEASDLIRKSVISLIENFKGL